MTDDEKRNQYADLMYAHITESPKRAADFISDQIASDAEKMDMEDIDKYLIASGVGPDTQTAYVAVVRLLLKVESEAEACDAISGLLTENMMSCNENSCLIDWEYEYKGFRLCTPLEVEVPHPYDTRLNSVPHWELT